jgi:acyl-homoserine lactone acylase PvdQ
MAGLLAHRKAQTGHALLFINPHLPFFGSGQVYEGHVHSEEGWNFTGYTRFGFPLPYVGHNENGGWVSTDNAADMVDVYTETFDDPTRPLAYKYGKGYRLATEHVEEIRVKTSTGLETRKFTMRKTHHGPILGTREGKMLALRMAKFESDGWLREWYDMTRAKSLDALKKAMTPLNMLFGNMMYADRQGNTWYLYNGAVPKRDPRFDWTQPVDGSDPRPNGRVITRSMNCPTHEPENRLDAKLQHDAFSADERRQSGSERLSKVHGPGRGQPARRDLERDPG